MKSEPKAFASLSSGLLARKGAARPAMRPQGFGQMGGGLDDLGWNDMGFEPPKPAVVPSDSDHDAFGESLPEQPLRNPLAALTPVHSPVHSQHAEITERLIGADFDEDEEVDETAELYEPEADVLPQAHDAEPTAAISPESVEAVVPPEPAQLAVPVAAPPAAVRRAPRPRAEPGSKAKAAFTLRLDPERHLKLRLACALSGRSAQLLVTEALDQLLTRMPELEAMAANAKRKG